LFQLLKLQVVTVPLSEFADTLTGCGVPRANRLLAEHDIGSLVTATVCTDTQGTHGP
jgi:hypothetical protein